MKDALRSAGCYFERQGKGDQEIWYSPHTGKRFPVDNKDLVAAYRERNHETGRADPSLQVDVSDRVDLAVTAATYTGSGAAFIRSMLKRLLTLRSGTAAISLR